MRNRFASKLGFLPLLVLLVACSAPATQVPIGETARAAREPSVVALTPEMVERAGVRTATVRRRPLLGTETYSATVEPTRTGAAVVASLVNGTVTRLLVDLGQSVRQGQALLEMVSPEAGQAKAEYRSALARLEQAKTRSNLAQTQVDLAGAAVQREKLLVAKGISALQSQQEAEARLAGIRADRATARSDVGVAQAAAAAAASRLRAFGLGAGQLRQIAQGEDLDPRLFVVSPIAGRVIALQAQLGQAVALTAPLMTVGGLDRVYVQLLVPQARLAELNPGDLVRFMSEVAPGRTFVGRVLRQAQSLDPTTRNAEVRVEIANPGSVLKPGTLVQATVRTRLAGDAIVLPATALQQVKGKDVVFVKIGPNTFRARPVAVGQKTAEAAQILRGVAAGESVVTNGSFSIKAELLKASLQEEE